jgi:hypothetical protein
MPTYDVIEAALTAPIDWTVFEKLVVEILAQDDLPRLRRAGGYKDSGVDAYDTALYSDETRAETIVQITSQRAQTLKVESTLQRIKSAGITPKAIIFVFRHPVSSLIRANIGRQCATESIHCDVRDQNYLMMQLGKNKTGLFTRYFEEVKRQFEILLASPDPLATASDRVRHAVLLSVASFVIHPHARLVRQALFHKTTIAALVALGQATVDQLLTSVRQLIPEESVSSERVVAALDELKKNGDCARVDETWSPTEACIAKFSYVMGAVRESYREMLSAVFTCCKTSFRGDQAIEGIIERNVRRALLRLLRVVGPFDAADENAPFVGSSSLPEISACLSQDLKDAVARCVIIAFGGYIEDPQNTDSLALFARSYSALALRNLDPIGRRWQQVALHRSIIALDTDALLKLLIRELPEHQALKTAVEAIAAQGTRIVVSPTVVSEAAGHISRANRTFKRCGEQLSRMSKAMVDATVWHAVVQGYYYARHSGYKGSWTTYWAGYYDDKNAEEFVRYQVSKIANCQIEELSDIPHEWFEDLEMLTDYIVQTKESHRYKAEFREPEYMKGRVREDVRMAMHLAAYEGGGGDASRGYLTTEDRAFFNLEQHPQWSKRRRVAILTRALPQLADFACGARLADDDLVRLLYEPAVAAAAQSLAEEIDTLTALGVNLKDVSLPRLEWALQKDIHDAIHNFRKDDLAENKLNNAARLVGLATAKGLSVDEFVAELSKGYEEAKKAAHVSAVGEEAAGEILKRVVLALTKTKRNKRRANRVLKEFGLTVSDLENGDDDDSQQPNPPYSEPDLKSP